MPETQSKAFQKFMRTYNRAFGMVGRHYVVAKEFLRSNPGKPWNETHDDLFRAGIVLAVAAMDSYFTDRFCEGLVPYLKKDKINKALIVLLEDSGFNTQTALEMFQMQRPHRRLSNMMRNKLDLYVTQNLQNVNHLYKAFGYDNFVQSAQGIVRRKTIEGSVKILVDRRHEIVHQGDYNSHGKLNKVDFAKLVKRIGDIKLLVEGCEKLLAKKGI